ARAEAAAQLEAARDRRPRQLPLAAAALQNAEVVQRGELRPRVAEPLARGQVGLVLRLRALPVAALPVEVAEVVAQLGSEALVIGLDGGGEAALEQVVPLPPLAGAAEDEA